MIHEDVSSKLVLQEGGSDGLRDEQLNNEAVSFPMRWIRYDKQSYIPEIRDVEGTFGSL